MVGALSRTRRRRDGDTRRAVTGARAISLVAGRAQGVAVCAGAAYAVSDVVQTPRKGVGEAVSLEEKSAPRTALAGGFWAMLHSAAPGMDFRPRRALEPDLSR